MSHTNCVRNRKILIIGAGAAGVAAASRLYDAGFTDIVVLEVNDRIGGRIHTVKFGDKLIDLGAEFCHGKKGNVVFELVNDLKVLVPDPSDYDFFYPDGRCVNSELKTTLVDIFNEVYYQEDRSSATNSIGEYFTDRFLERIHDVCDEEERKVAVEVLQVFRKLIMRYKGSFSWFDPIASSDYVSCEDASNWIWNGFGYKTVLDVLTKKLPKELFCLSKEVVRVSWGENATVSCADGSEYHADHVIVTVSLGVLKSQHGSWFQPSLPLNKVGAIKRISYEATLKIFLHFPKKWWSFGGAQFVWTKNALENATKTEQLLINGKAWVQDIIGVYSVPQNPNVLRMWFTGSLLPETEALSEEILIDGLMYVLKLFLGERYPNMNRPDKLVRHNWYSDPYFRGSYSFQGFETRRGKHSDHIELSLPLHSECGKPTVLFAGEASHPKFYSTVHGAIETGFREADRLIALYT